MQTYEQFVAAIDPDDLFILALLSQGGEPGYIDPAEITDMQARMTRLLAGDYALRVEEAREVKQGTTWHFFKAFVHPVIKSYAASAAKERVQLSRDPVPAP